MMNYFDVKFFVEGTDGLNKFDICVLDSTGVISYEATHETDAGAGYTPCGSLYLVAFDAMAQDIVSYTG